MTEQLLCIGVMSASGSSEQLIRQELIRNSWGRSANLDPNIELIFFGGPHYGPTEPAKDYLPTAELEEGTSDFRIHATLNLLKHAYDTGAAYLLKCLDTTYIDVNSVLYWIDKKLGGFDLLGIQSIDYEIKGNLIYPDSGHGYIMNRSAISEILRQSKELDISGRVNKVQAYLKIRSPELANDDTIIQFLLDRSNLLSSYLTPGSTEKTFGWNPVYNEGFLAIQNSLATTSTKGTLIPKNILYQEPTIRDFSNFISSRLPEFCELKPKLKSIHVIEKSPKILVAVTSSTLNDKFNIRRELCKKSWISDLSSVNSADCLFCITDNVTTPTVKDQYLLLSNSVHDEYLSLPLRTIDICRFAKEMGYHFLFKCDDDSYLDAVRFSEWINSNFRDADYIGIPYRSEITKTTYAQGGLGYVLSNKALSAIIEHVDSTNLTNQINFEILEGNNSTRKYLIYEDALVGWLVSELCLKKRFMELENPSDRTYSWHWVYKDGFDLIRDTLKDRGEDIYSNTFNSRRDELYNSGPINIRLNTLYSEPIVRGFSNIVNWLKIHKLHRDVERDL